MVLISVCSWRLFCTVYSRLGAPILSSVTELEVVCITTSTYHVNVIKVNMLDCEWSLRVFSFLLMQLPNQMHLLYVNRTMAMGQLPIDATTVQPRLSEPRLSIPSIIRTVKSSIDRLVRMRRGCDWLIFGGVAPVHEAPTQAISL